MLLDRTQGTEQSRPITRLTPEVPFPEVEGWPNHYYASPWPLSETHYLVAWSDRGLPPHCEVSDDRNPVNAQGVYLYDAFGNLNLLYRDAAISSLWPIALKARTKPPVLPSAVRWDGPQEGRFILQDVYRGLDGVPRGSIKQIRVIGVPPKTQPQMNSPSLGVSGEEPGKFVLGAVPVESDGSAYFRVPVGRVDVLPGVGRRRAGRADHAQPRLRAAGRDARLHRLPRVARGGPGGGRACRWPRPARPRSSSPARPAPGPCASTNSCSRCSTASACSATGPRARMQGPPQLDLTPARSYDSLLTFGGQNLRGLVLRARPFDRRQLPGAEQQAAGAVDRGTWP